MRLVSVALFVLTLLPLDASADAIGGPRGDCAPGTYPSMAGHGTWLCVPRDCQAGSTCEGDVGLGAGPFGGAAPGPSECREVALCITTTTISQGMPSGRDLGPPPTAQTVVGECGDGDTCERGECSRALRCVEHGEAPEEAQRVEPEPTEDDADEAPEQVEREPTEDGPDETRANEEGAGCGCSTPGRPGTASAVCIIGALALLRRRR